MPALRSSNALRYTQFAIIVLGAGAMYPIMYLRQNFETSILEAFRISSSDLGELYSLLGIIYTISYLPSGRLADRVSPRLLMSLSLAMVGVLGLWFSTYPSLFELRLIFLGWGVAGGLMFWASLIRGVKMLAGPLEQGRFFGILDGGRGLVEALLASVAIAVFATMSDQGSSATVALRPIIYLYSFSCIAFAGMIFLFVDTGEAVRDEEALAGAAVVEAPQGSGFVDDLMRLLRIPQLWVLAAILFAGHQLFWATYSFSAFLQVHYGVTAVAAASVTLSKLWMRPLGGVTAGFLGDMFSREKLLAGLFFCASAGLLGMSYLPIGNNVLLIMAVVLAMGYFTYAIHGLYWALLDHCPVPTRLTGLSIGLVSFIGYLPDVLMPLLDAYLSRQFERELSFRIYFTIISLCGFVGAWLCLRFRRESSATAVPIASGD